MNGFIPGGYHCCHTCMLSPILIGVVVMTLECPQEPFDSFFESNVFLGWERSKLFWALLIVKLSTRKLSDFQVGALGLEALLLTWVLDSSVLPPLSLLIIRIHCQLQGIQCFMLALRPLRCSAITSRREFPPVRLAWLICQNSTICKGLASQKDYSFLESFTPLCELITIHRAKCFLIHECKLTYITYLQGDDVGIHATNSQQDLGTHYVLDSP